MPPNTVSIISADFFVYLYKCATVYMNSAEGAR